MNLTNKNGFTLIETLFTFGILAICICGILLTYLRMFILSDLSRDITLATNAAQAKIEELRRTSFGSLSALNGTTFDITGFTSSDAKGRIEISDLTLRAAPTETLKKARVLVCFKSRGRVIGEDQNLNGALNAGEDRDSPGQPGYGRLDSPIELVTLIVE